MSARFETRKSAISRRVLEAELEVPAAPPTVEEALARALAGASEAGRWDVVAMLARELEARRLAGSNVVPLDALKASQG